MSRCFLFFSFIAFFIFGEALAEEELKKVQNQTAEPIVSGQTALKKENSVDETEESSEEKIVTTEPLKKEQDKEIVESEEQEEFIAKEALEQEELSKGDIEEFKVTGSRIRRIDFEGPSPLTVWTKEDLENSGYLSLSELFKNTSLSNFGTNLLRHRSTLVLVNGKRLVHDSGMDFIPTSAIERVEILKDGASALYGSDVIGGSDQHHHQKRFCFSGVLFEIGPNSLPFL